MIVRVHYQGHVDIEVNSPDPLDEEEIQQLALEEIEAWPEHLFLERLELQFDDIEVNPQGHE